MSPTPSPLMPLILMGVLMVFILSVFLISTLSKTRTKRYDIYDKHIKELTTEITNKKLQLEKLAQELERRSIDRKTGLSNIVSEALDMYDKSQIRIPADILEELAVSELTSLPELIEYIETQRNFWKWENTKRVYKGSVKKHG